MNKGKATQVQIIFISDNPQLVAGLDVSRMTDAERATWDTVQDAAASVAQQYPAAQVYTLDMNRYRGTQIVQLERWGIARYPAVRIWAQYADGSEGYYNYWPPVPGTTPDLAKIAPSVEALYLGEFGENSLLCKLFPPLCKLGALAWLGVTIFAAYEANRAKGFARAAWITGAALAGNEFLQRGGVKNFSIGSMKMDVKGKRFYFIDDPNKVYEIYNTTEYGWHAVELDKKGERKKPSAKTLLTVDKKLLDLSTKLNALVFLP